MFELEEIYRKWWGDFYYDEEISIMIRRFIWEPSIHHRKFENLDAELYIAFTKNEFRILTEKNIRK